MDYLTHAECICMAFEEQSVYPPYGINDCNGKLESPDPDKYIQRIAREMQEEHRKGCKSFIIKWNTVRVTISLFLVLNFFPIAIYCS